jgi:hypothetical protein
MCLIISYNQEENEKDLKRWLGRRRKFAYVYKILRKYDDENFYRSENFHDFIWNFSKQKIYQVNRLSEPTHFELTFREINQGLHVYTNLEIAQRYYCTNRVVVKFRVLKEDIIAVQNGCYWKSNNFTELVCKRLEFIKVIEE